ncbi:aminopeptidase P family protein [bacterium]|nr:aminopeptidase P family protein [candidate division CSSED10-310 bacterium]
MCEKNTLDNQIPTFYNEIHTRISTLQKSLREASIDVAWIQQTTDLYYYSGTSQIGHLLIPASQEPELFIRRYYPRAAKETPLCNTHQITTFKDVTNYVTKNPFRRIGLELDVLSVNQFKKMIAPLPQAEFIDISPIIRKQRSIKSSREIDAIKNAANQLHLVFQKIPEWITEGMREIDLAAKIECFLREHGHQGLLPTRTMNTAIFYGNVLFGQSSAERSSLAGPTCGAGLYNAYPNGAGWHQLEAHTPIFIDLVSGYDGYMADATRIFSLGRLPESLKKLHQSCISIQNSLVEEILKGTAAKTLCQIACNMAQKLDLTTYFMGPPDDKVPFVGHGIGLEVDELPIIAKGYDDYLPPGSVIAIEPKAVIPGKGAVGIENTWVVYSHNCCNLIEFPDNIIEI